jgi:cytoskeleton protein RodZ
VDNNSSNTDAQVLLAQSTREGVFLAPTGTQTVDSASSEAVTTPSASGMKTMTLTLSKDSWLDIRDKTRKRLLYKTEKAGQTIEVTGLPPFYVYVGTPDGVTIQYQGKDVPFETHKTGMFARFKLDDEMLEAL